MCVSPVSVERVGWGVVARCARRSAVLTAHGRARARSGPEEAPAPGAPPSHVPRGARGRRGESRGAVSAGRGRRPLASPRPGRGAAESRGRARERPRAGRAGARYTMNCADKTQFILGFGILSRLGTIFNFIL